MPGLGDTCSSEVPLLFSWTPCPGAHQSNSPKPGAGFKARAWHHRGERGEKSHCVPGLVLHITTSPVIRGATAIAQGTMGHGRKEDLPPPLQVSGEGLQPIGSVLCGCLGLPFMKQLEPPSLAPRKQREDQ